MFTLLIIAYYNGKPSLFLVKKDVFVCFPSQIINMLYQIFKQVYRSSSHEGNLRGA